MIGLNTVRGEGGEERFRPVRRCRGARPEARSVIDQAVDYARSISLPQRFMSWRENPVAGKRQRRFSSANLDYACGLAGDITILIEPINDARRAGLPSVDDGACCGDRHALSAART
jgi:hydroxypyruvate isomerase